MERTDALKVLAIDDKPDNLTTLRAVVREALPQTLVLTATNGRAGIELAAAEDPDVILLDIVMPGMDGFEVCRRLKADDRLKDIPVVFLTALKTDTASRVKALEVGGEGFLAKPLETAELTAQIRAMTKVKAANRSQRTEKQRLETLVAERTADLHGTLAAMRESQEQLRFQAEIIDNSPMIAAYDDAELNVVWVNRAYQKATGLSLEEARGRKCYQVWNLSGPCRNCPVITAIETGESAAHELTPDNQDDWPEAQGCWLSQAVPVRDAQDNVIGALEFAIDITDRKQVEDALRESEIRYRTLFESMIEQVHFWELVRDIQGNVRTWRLVDANSVSLESWNRTRAQTIGKTADEIWPNSNVIEQFMPIVKKIFEEGTPHRWESSFPETNQTLAMTSVAFGEYFFSTGLDITERKQAEEKMAEQLHELQRWYDVMLGREDRIIELKQEINELLAKAGEPARFPSAVAGNPSGTPDGSPPLEKTTQ